MPISITITLNPSHIINPGISSHASRTWTYSILKSQFQECYAYYNIQVALHEYWKYCYFNLKSLIKFTLKFDLWTVYSLADGLKMILLTQLLKAFKYPTCLVTVTVTNKYSPPAFNVASNSISLSITIMVNFHRITTPNDQRYYQSYESRKKNIKIDIENKIKISHLSL